VPAQERLRIMEELGHQHGIDISYAFLGTIYTHAFDYKQACEIIDLHPVMYMWAWSEQALIAVGRYGEAMETLPGLTAIIAEGGWRYYSVDNLTAWAMLLTSDCPLLRAHEPLPQVDRNKMAREILTLVRDYNPDRSRAISRTRAATLLAEFGLSAIAGVDGALPEPDAPSTATRIAQTLLAITLDSCKD